MRLNLFYLLFFIMILSCRNESGVVDEGNGEDVQVELSHDQLLRLTTWKLVGIVNTKTGNVKELKIQDESNYYISFEDFNYINGFSTANKLRGVYFPCYEDHSLLINCVRLTDFSELFDGALYVSLLNKVQFFALKENELRLYFNDKRDYLMFKNCNCWEMNCSNKYDINKNEYIMTWIEPDIVSNSSDNKWIVENNTTSQLLFGEGFVLEYFNENQWKDITPNFIVILIGYILFEGETKCLSYSAKPSFFSSNLYSIILEFNNGKPGRYRISKRFNYNSMISYNLCAEFTVI